jgi:hypothetical protein
MRLAKEWLAVVGSAAAALAWAAAPDAGLLPAAPSTLRPAARDRGPEARANVSRPGPVAAARSSGHPAAQAVPATAPPPAAPGAAEGGPLPIPPPPLRSPRNASYSIDVTLDPVRRTLSGREVITWRNVTTAATPDLRLHLYWNAWRNTQSTWLRERALAGQIDATIRGRRPADWGWSNITAIRLLGAGTAPPLDLGDHEFIAPDDGNAEDRTLLRVPLPAPVRPGETVNLEVEWTAQIPRTFARTGGIGRYFFLAQWFPKVGVLEADGWRARQFHAGTEFFADYGVYDVRLRVPAGWVVGATGREQSRRDNGDGTVVHRYVEADVHDFAWTTSPDFVERNETFEHPGLPPVEMRLLLQPEHAGQADRHFAATRAALRYYGEWYGPYPYGHITVVDPAWQSGSGGMEYPTLFTCGSRWIAPRGVTQPEGVTVHEAGHQFWYGIVGNNEFEHAWLDEGLNTFSTARVIEEAFSPNFASVRYFGGFVPWVFRDIRLSRATDGNGFWGYRANARTDTPSTPSWQYFPATGSTITYGKTALWLHTLERHLGWPVLQRAMATFFARSQFRHPTPDDFFRTVNEVSGHDLTWYFDQVYRGSVVFDYGIASLESRAKTTRGFAERDGGLAYVAGDDAAPAVYETTVIARRYGEGIFPVDVEVTFEDGETVRERWLGRDRWRAFVFERRVKARSAVVDPDRVLLLDVDITNNSYALEPRAGRAATTWALEWMVWLQDLLMVYAFFV